MMPSMAAQFQGMSVHDDLNGRARVSPNMQHGMYPPEQSRPSPLMSSPNLASIGGPVTRTPDQQFRGDTFSALNPFGKPPAPPRPTEGMSLSQIAAWQSQPSIAAPMQPNPFGYQQQPQFTTPILPFQQQQHMPQQQMFSGPGGGFQNRPNPFG